MSEYTAKDFKNAKFAEHRHGAKAVRWEMNYRVPWHTVIGDRFSDEQMAESGWRPVHEHNPHATDALEEEIQDLRDENAGLKMRVEYLNGELELWQERASQAEAYARKAESAPVTLDALREAYETAERVVPDSPIRPGDVVIHPTFGGYYVGRVEGDADKLNTRGDVRVLNRAPQPEPWQALADEMEELYDGYSLRAAEAAQFLHERGVRVVGGDET